MAQFDVHQNIGRGRAAISYVVVLQSRAHDHVPTRLVAPLLDGAASAPLRPPATLPRFTVADRPVILDILQTTAIPRGALGPLAGSLADDNSATRIVAALDEAISRAHG